jgi:hypothetical protein
LKRHPATRRGRIEPLLVQEQVDPVGMKVGKETQQGLEASAQPVRRPCHDHIEAAAGFLRQGVKRRPLLGDFAPLRPWTM